MSSGSSPAPPPGPSAGPPTGPTPSPPTGPPTGRDAGRTFFDAVGGERTFRALTRSFYRRVADDPVLRPLYPDEDLAAAEERLCLFLIQYWGGPHHYMERRGHPRLRMRHAPFAIGPAERDAWLACMRQAVDDIDLTDEQDALLWDYLVRAAFSMQNRHPERGATLPLA